MNRKKSTSDLKIFTITNTIQTNGMGRRFAAAPCQLSLPVKNQLRILTHATKFIKSSLLTASCLVICTLEV